MRYQRLTQLVLGLSLSACLASASSLLGQEPERLGINLSVGGNSQVGVTYQLSSGFALRPGVMFGWSRQVPGPNVSTTGTSYGGFLDALFMLSRAPGVRPYLGAGGSYVFQHGSGGANAHTAGGSALVGVRARILERVHLYGEASLRYSHYRSSLTGLVTDQLSLNTTPLAVVIFLH